MADLTNFVGHGYQVVKELGHNLEGGRFTYLAKRLADNVHVVVKQFQFSKGAGWDGFRAIEREMQSLQGLNHRGIPKYLDKFETDSGYCLVTEYFPADTLAVGRSFTPDQIKQIAVQLLEILVYLQERMPPVIHRDVKPENILVDDNLNVYLIDFGFARVGSGSVAMSSANAGTFGFMAPEQIRNLRLTNASDLYGLGLTLICLIGAIRSTDIGNYIDFSNQLDRSKIDPKLKGCSLTFVKWLDQMVAPDPSKRFADAKVALKGLQPLYVTRYPSVEISKLSLEFKATSLGEKLTQTITLSNSTPETILEGRWEVEPHPNDPPHTPDSHAWISFSPKQFKGNQVDCRVTVDTSKLFAEAIGKRTILLNTNDVTTPNVLALNIDTAPLPLENKVAPYFEISIYLFISIALSLFSSSFDSFPTTSSSFYAQGNSLFLAQVVFSATISSSIVLLFGIIMKMNFFSFAISYLKLPKQSRYNNSLFCLLLCFAIIGGFSLGICLKTGLLMNPYLLYLIRTRALVPDSFYLILTTFFTLGSLALALIFTFVISKIQRNRKIAAYHLKEEHLINP